MVQNGSLVDHDTFEDYLDSQITDIDLFYLEDKELARQLVELGYRGSGEPLKRYEFEQRKVASSSIGVPLNGTTPDHDELLSTAHSTWKLNPFLTALAEREESNRSGKIMSIIYIRTTNAKGQEISGYIDLTHRLKSNNFEGIFEGTKMLLPKTSDLSFYNWATNATAANHSPNFTVDNEEGILFKSKKDRKVINVDPRKYATHDPNDSTSRISFAVKGYSQIVIYDHFTKKKL